MDYSLRTPPLAGRATDMQQTNHGSSVTFHSQVLLLGGDAVFHGPCLYAEIKTLEKILCLSVGCKLF